MELETRSWQRRDGIWVEVEMTAEAWRRWDDGEPVGCYGEHEQLLMDEDGSALLRRRPPI
jgi:hypothetical protein